MIEHSTIPKRFLRLPAVIDKTGFSRSTIYLKVSKGMFPAPVHLGERSVAWLESDIHNWMDERVQAHHGYSPHSN